MIKFVKCKQAFSQLVFIIVFTNDLFSLNKILNWECNIYSLERSRAIILVDVTQRTVLP